MSSLWYRLLLVVHEREDNEEVVKEDNILETVRADRICFRPSLVREDDASLGYCGLMSKESLLSGVGVCNAFLMRAVQAKGLCPETDGIFAKDRITID